MWRMVRVGGGGQRVGWGRIRVKGGGVRSVEWGPSVGVCAKGGGGCLV